MRRQLGDLSLAKAFLRQRHEQGTGLLHHRHLRRDILDGADIGTAAGNDATGVAIGSSAGIAGISACIAGISACPCPPMAFRGSCAKAGMPGIDPRAMSISMPVACAKSCTVGLRGSISAASMNNRFARSRSLT